MKKLLLGAALGPLALALSACGGGESGANNMAADSEASDSLGNDGGTMTSDTDASTAGGNSGGSASAQGGTIVEENGKRYRVDAGGKRVRINADGVAIDGPDVDVDLPDVDVGINEKGNPDVDVRGKADVDVRTGGNTSR
jgi:hypothetical protein